MTTPPPRPTGPRAAAEALAEGLAQQLRSWSLASGGDATAAATVARLARELSLALDEGHVCLPPAAAAGQREALLASGVVGTPAAPGVLPLILDDAGRLYLHRHFDYERRLARRLHRAATVPGVDQIAPSTRALLHRLFDPGRDAGEAADAAPDWQRLCAALALRRSLVIISGGPGTGKTTTVVNLLACLLDQQPGLRVALAAPTGKAAARLGEALRLRAAHLPQALRERLPTEASTVHRLLGAGPGGFVHDARHRLAIDLLVVDEASMLDLALATKLLEAVPDAARIVLLGDQDQLAAVEAGAVFAEASADPSLGDDCRAQLASACGIAEADIVPPIPRQPSVLQDSTVWLTRNFRFAAGSGIARLAEAIRRSAAAEVLAALRGPGDASLSWIDDATRVPAPATLAQLVDGYTPYLRAVQRDPLDIAGIAAAFERFRVLCALREGARGVAAINRLMTEVARTQLASLQVAHGTAADAAEWFIGRPVLVQRNDPLLRLYNGDVGFVLPGHDGAPMVHFADAAGGFRAILPQRLPSCETAFAMTVHKAQGSEFDAVLLVLPAVPSRVLTRELLYTAVTRARQRVAVAGSQALLAAAAEAPTQRHSGLLDRLREAADG